MRKMTAILTGILLLCGCGRSSGGESGADSDAVSEHAAATASATAFDADSAMNYVRRQVEFGPRVPGSQAHRLTGDWLAAELRRHGAEVCEQTAMLRAFDGTQLNMRNIMGSYRPEKSDRLLLLAHYDTRPWADNDSDEANRNKPLDGANDGASGVAVLLETARMLGRENPDFGVDILFVDCEDYGTDGVEDSWAMGAAYFASHPIKPGYRPSRAILLDMVGGREAVFPAEYFSRQAAPELDDAFRTAAAATGHADRFPAVYGSAVTDDHIPLIEQGIPAIDIIDYRVGQGFCPTWHTLDDNVDNIDPESLRAVGDALFKFLEASQTKHNQN